jgi:hypothetical protein
MYSFFPSHDQQMGHTHIINIFFIFSCQMPERSLCPKKALSSKLHDYASGRITHRFLHKVFYLKFQS